LGDIVFDMSHRKNSTLEILEMLAALFLALSVLSFFVQGSESTLLMLRFISIFGLFFSGIGLILVARIPNQPVIKNTSPLAELENKSLFVEIHDQSIMHTSPVIDLENLDDLIRLAEWHGTVVFHLTLNFIHLYYVRGMDNVTYRYVLSTGRGGFQEEITMDKSMEDTLLRKIDERDLAELVEPASNFEVHVNPSEVVGPQESLETENNNILPSQEKPGIESNHYIQKEKVIYEISVGSIEVKY